MKKQAKPTKKQNAPAIGKLPPHNVEAEQAVLGSLLMDKEAIACVAAWLRPEDFYRETHSEVYAAILALWDRREPVDFVTLCDELEKRDSLDGVGGASYITGLINAVPTSAHAEHYGRIVERTATRRRLIQAATRVTEMAYDEDNDDVPNQAEQLIFGAVQRRAARDLMPLSGAATSLFESLERPVQGCPTGLRDLDKLLGGGLQKSDLILIAGRPGMGKTSLAITIAKAVAERRDGAVLVFSLEMSREQLMQRLVAMETGVDTQRQRSGDLTPDDVEKVVRALGKLAELPMLVDDSAAITPLEMRSKIRRFLSVDRAAFIVVDYLQLMSAGVRTENAVQEISYISRALKQMAREFDVPVVAVSQLSRALEHRQEKRATLADLRGSGSLEQDADVVIFLYGEWAYREGAPKITEANVAKHRNGPTGKIELVFLPTKTQLVDCALIDEAGQPRSARRQPTAPQPTPRRDGPPRRTARESEQIPF